MADISERGRQLIKSFEGLRLHSYKDSVGVDTIGWGHTGPRAHPSKGPITYQEADELFAQDVAKFTKGVLDLVQVAVTQAQLDSLCSFAYNVGLGAFARSTMLAYVNRNDFAKAANEFNRWVYAGNTMLPGLVRRREIERALFAGAESPREAVDEAQSARMTHVASATVSDDDRG